jgi:glycosyltransferase involved in cell wall biosynthesis
MAIHPGDLTVVVPTRNEERNIGNFLGSIPDGIRLVVVDASTDSTPDIVSRARPHYTTLIRYPGTVTEARLGGSGRG